MPRRLRARTTSLLPEWRGNAEGKTPRPRTVLRIMAGGALSAALRLAPQSGPYAFISNPDRLAGRIWAIDAASVEAYVSKVHATYFMKIFGVTGE